MKPELKCYLRLILLSVVALAVIILSCQVVEDDEDDDSDPYCGDGVVNQASEECEHDQECPVDYTCLDSCECVPEEGSCGDGMVSPGEDCEEDSHCAGSQVCIGCACIDKTVIFPLKSTGGIVKTGTAPVSTGGYDINIAGVSFTQSGATPANCPPFNPGTAACGKSGDSFQGTVDATTSKSGSKGEWAGAVFVTVDGYDGYLEITTFADEIEVNPAYHQVVSDLTIADDAEVGDFVMNFGLAPADVNGDPDYSIISNYVSAPLYIVE